jgi:hypothetical protein
MAGLIWLFYVEVGGMPEHTPQWTTLVVALDVAPLPVLFIWWLTDRLMTRR